MHFVVALTDFGPLKQPSGSWHVMGLGSTVPNCEISRTAVSMRMMKYGLDSMLDRQRKQFIPESSESGVRISLFYWWP